MQYNAYSKDDCPSQASKLQVVLSVIIIICSSQMHAKKNQLLCCFMSQIADMQMYASTFIHILKKRVIIVFCFKVQYT